jgi:hypothetical protein
MVYLNGDLLPKTSTVDNQMSRLRIASADNPDERVEGVWAGTE